MSQELIAILGMGVMLGIFLWRESGRIRTEARDAHEKIGERIGTFESKIGERIGAIESKIGERIGAIESKIGTIESKIGIVESKIDKLTGYIRGYFRQDVPD